LLFLLKHVSEVFLEVNGAKLNATDDEVFALFLGIAAGESSRDAVEDFFRVRVVVGPSR